MSTIRLARRQVTLGTLLVAGALVLPVTAAQAKVRVSILGWSTAPAASAPQVRDNGTIEQCLDAGNGQRSIRVIFRGRGIAKRTKVGVGLWGGPPRAGFASEPADADVLKTAFRWPVGETKTSIQPYGYSFAQGPFGPIQINGEWQVKVLVKQKVVARGKVTIVC
jgi:hypothetical protein